MEIESYQEIFSRATEGHTPFKYQERFAWENEEIPEFIRVPTGAGKTACVILGWLYRRKFSAPEIRQSTPRRLIYCLPMRVLVEQTYREAINWLHKLGLLSVADKTGFDPDDPLNTYEPGLNREEPTGGFAREQIPDEEPVSVHLLMGGNLDEDWDEFPERDAILIGTQDMLLSRALNRGYAMSPFRWPIDYGLLNNDCHWVLDEVQLMGNGLATSAQLDAFRERWGTFGNAGTTWMSATSEPKWLETVDRDAPSNENSLFLSENEGSEDLLESRIRATKQVATVSDVRLKSTSKSNTKDYISALGDTIQARYEERQEYSSKDHPPYFLVILNTVERARKLYRSLRNVFPDREKRLQELEKKINNPEEWGKRKQDGDLYKKTREKLEEYRQEREELRTSRIPDLQLIHSRFRPVDRKERVNQLEVGPGNREFPEDGRILISTQVVEAGVDLSAGTLFTELAPWPSLVQRAGRLNRYGKRSESTLYWMDINTDSKRTRDETALPYQYEELDRSREILEAIDDISPRTIEGLDEGIDYRADHVIRRRDLKELFDTTPDLSGNHIDVSRFVRDTTDKDVSVYWRDIIDLEDLPERDLNPDRDELCSVPVSSFREFVGSHDVFQYDSLEGEWQEVEENDVVPGRVYLVPSSEGGYTPETGWDAGAEENVEPVTSTDQSGEGSNSAGEDPETFTRTWQTLEDHSREIQNEISRLIESVKRSAGGLDEIDDILKRAAVLHDAGKAHPVFQEALLNLVDDPENREEKAKNVWAKSGTDGRLRYDQFGRDYFRHELVSMLQILNNDLPEKDQPWREDLLLFLVAAHHGKIRLSLRSLPGEPGPSDVDAEQLPRGLRNIDYGEEERHARGVWEKDRVPEVKLDGEAVPETEIDLSVMEIGGEGRSWIERVGSLRDHGDFGPFRLSYLETLLRISDWRASS